MQQQCYLFQVVTTRIQLVILLLLGMSVPCFAAGGTGEYALPWPHKPEILMYHSCGCGDSCWVAEVRERKTKKVLARLSCDCRSLSYSKNGRTPDVPINESCEEMNESTNKADLIKNKIEQLRKPTARNGRGH
jgi:hypothetical protein